jgi:hypothetical protein
VYALTLSVQHADLKRAGFQLSVRFDDGSQAGELMLPDSALLRVQRMNNVEYLSHTAGGSHQVDGQTARWRFLWQAPASDRRVVFNAAVNVANHDASEFGDRIFTATYYSGGEPIRK